MAWCSAGPREWLIALTGSLEIIMPSEDVLLLEAGICLQMSRRQGRGEGRG